MLAVYRETAMTVKERAASVNASCRKGCSSCCYALVHTTLPEAMAVAEEIFTNATHAKLRPTLAGLLRDQLKVAAEGVRRGVKDYYFKARVPCVFLKHGACSIYASRPSACRLHYVISEPELCSPAVTATVRRVNMSDIESRHLEAARQASNQAKLPLVAGPFQAVLLEALKMRGDV